MKENKKSPDGRSGLESEKIYTYENYNSKDQDHPLLFDDVDEREKSLFDLILTGKTSVEEVLQWLEVEDFRSETHKLIYGAIIRLYARKESIDVLAVCCELKNTPRPNGEEWSSYITYIIETALPCVEGNIEFHIQKIKAASRCRKMSGLASQVYEAAISDNTEKVKHLIEKLIETQADIGSYNRLRPTSAKDLSDIPPPASLWGGFIYPGCITQLNAEPGAGKSTLAYNLVGLGARGGEFLGIPFPKQIKTLYIDLESPVWLQRQKILSICGYLPENFYLLDRCNFPRDINDLRSLVKTEKFDLVVLDTQSKTLNLLDENDNSEANRMATLLRNLVKESGVAVLLIHHTKKSNGGKKVHKGRGASAIAGDVDIIANLETLDSETLRLEIVKSRMVCKFRSITMKKLGDDRFELVKVADGKQVSELYRTQECILSLLGNGKKWQTAEILERAELEGFKGRTIEESLKRLKDAGRVRKLAQGVYILAGYTLNVPPNNANDENYEIPEEFC